MSIRTWCGMALCGALVLLTGCQNKFTHQRFQMISVGVDTRDDVRQVLGDPTADLHEQWFYDNIDEYYSAVIHFNHDGRVIGKEWMDSATGKWTGTNPNADEPPEGEVRERHQRTRTYDD